MNNKDRERIWNHISTINKEIGGVKEHVSALATDVGWLKRFQWAILGTSITAVILIVTNYLIGG